PTTRYISRRIVPHNILAADHGVPRLESPHWPLVFMLVLTQAAAGIFLSAAVAGLFGLGARLRPLEFAAFVLCSAGLATSILHLGQPLKAWRAFLGWRKSWLSREIIALSLFAGMAASLVVAEFRGSPSANSRQDVQDWRDWNPQRPGYARAAGPAAPSFLA